METESTTALMGEAAQKQENDRAATAQYSRLVAICDRVMEASLLMIIVFAPAIFSTINADIFMLPKASFTRLFTFTALAAWGIKSVVGGDVRLVRTKVDIPLLGYLVLITLSALLGNSPIRAVLGEFERDDGLLHLLNYGLIFWLAVNVYTTRVQVWRVVKWQTMIGAAIAGYGVAQVFNIGTFGNYWELWPGGRAASTLGHPSFLSTYLGTIIPLALVLFASEKEAKKKGLWGLAIVVMAAGMLLSYGRSGWFGVTLASVLLVISLGWYRQLRKKLVLVATVTSFLAILGYFLVLPSLLPDLPRLPGQFSVKERLTQMIIEPGNDVRMFYWQGALGIIKENWALGVGQGNFQDAYYKFASLNYVRGEGFRMSPDKAHNEYLHIAAVSGIPSLGFYLWFLGGIAILAVKKRALLRSDPLIAGLCGAILSYSAAVTFLFSTVGDAPIYWWALGSLVALLGLESKLLGITSARYVPGPFLVNLGGVIILAASLLLTYHLVVRPLVSDYLVREADKSISAKEQQAVTLDSYSEDELKNISSDHASGRSSRAFTRSVELYEQALAWWPYQDAVWLKYSGVLRLASVTLGPDGARQNLDKAVRAANTAISMTPTKPSLYVQRGNIYMGLGEAYRNSALNDFRKAASMAPYYYDAHIALAGLALRLGLTDEGVAALRRAVEINPADRDARFNLALGYFNSARYESAEKTLKSLLAEQPGDMGARSLLASVYSFTARKSDAEAELRRALEIEPGNKEIEEALKMLLTPPTSGGGGSPHK